MTQAASGERPRAVWFRGIVWAAAAIALLYGCYLFAGFYLVPQLIRQQATAWVHTNLGKPIALGKIKFDPFRFSAEINDIAVPDQARPMVAVGRLTVDFSFLSLFQSTYRLDALDIERPFVHAIVRPDGSLNLRELVPPSHPDSEAPAFRIDTLRVGQGHIVFADRSLALKPEKTLAPITFLLKDFHTKSDEGGEFTFEGKSEHNESLAWRGTVSMAPIGSRGQFTIDGLRSDTIYQFLSEQLPVELSGGRIGLDGRYNFKYGEGTVRLDAAVPRLTLRDFAFRNKAGIFNGAIHADSITASVDRIHFATSAKGAVILDASVPHLALGAANLAGTGPADGQNIRVADITLDDVKFDLGKHQVSASALGLGGVALNLIREKNGAFSIMNFLPTQSAAAGTPASVKAATWDVRLANFRLKDAAVHLEDRAVKPMTQFALAPIEVTATGLGTDQTKPVSVEFSTGIDARGALKGGGAITPATRAADMQFTLDSLSLPALASYLMHYPALRLKSGDLSASGALSLSGGEKSELHFKGDAAIANLGLYDRVNNSSLLAWRAFQITGIDYRPGHLEIARGRLSRPFSRIAILPDRTLNFSALVTPAGKASATPARAPALQVRLKTLSIDSGTMSFSDYSITPNFEARIEALNGSVKNITSKPDAVAAVNLKGQVIDRFSPVTITGTANLFGYDRNTNIQAAFRNIELPVFNPYSDRYAGYAIAKGKLTTLLDYKIVNRALQADHHVIIDQLEWGEATDSRDKVPWPVGLITSLLKDRNGVIDLDVPVKGTLDDPTFQLGPIIWKIIGNLLEKIVTAPFSLIGSLFSGAEKAQFVDFAPGSAVLPTGSADGLAALAKGLGERPALQLDIPAGPAGKEDAISIADARIDALLMAKEIKKGQPADPAALSPDDQNDRLYSLYRSKFGKRPAYPAPPPEAPQADIIKKDAAQAELQKTRDENQWLRGELRKAMLPANAELAALGTARAIAVRDVLLAKGDIAPARVFMQAGQTATPTGALERVELKLR